MGQCLQGQRRSSLDYTDDTCCPHSCLGDAQPTELKSDSDGYAVYCHETPSTICNEWWSSTIGVKATINVCVVGLKGVGKSTLIQCASGKTRSGASDECDPTLNTFEAPGDTVISVVVGDQDCDLQIQSLGELDLIYPTSQLRGDSLRNGRIFLCCFSVDSVSSYQAAVDAYHRILRNKEGDSNFSVILVATKCDGNRNVDNVKTMEFTRKEGIGYIETSAKGGLSKSINVGVLFEQCVFEHWVQTVARNSITSRVNGRNSKDELPLIPSVSVSNSMHSKSESHLTATRGLSLSTRY